MFSSLMPYTRWMVPALVMLLAPAMAFAQAAEAEAAAAPPVIDVLLTANNLWMMICAGLVFIMHLGFASLESGLCRSKNTVNILTKNVAIIGIGILTYYAVGFNLMYPGDWNIAGWLGFAGFGIAAEPGMLTADYADAGYTYWTDFLFQAMFAATAATIVSGAVAERIKLLPFLVFSMIFVAILYPWVGSWHWGEGWLSEAGFIDFAGSTLVHAVGGWGALAGVIILGPRLGKYVDGKVHPIPGHSLPLATIGVFLLWLGWFGFNGGSVLSANPAETSLVLVTTCLAAAAGGLVALLTAQLALGNADLSMSLNGILAGLVGITAGANIMSPGEAILVGGIAGSIVVFAVLMFDRLRLDDPVGAISVHLVCGIWGTLACGIFGSAGFIGLWMRGEPVAAGISQLGVQAMGVFAYGVAAFGFALALFAILKVLMGIRVSADEEIEGLDIGEHGMVAYPDFVSGSLISDTTGSAPVQIQPIGAPIAQPRLA
jgi:ammonium transporter, Amt family